MSLSKQKKKRNYFAQDQYFSKAFKIYKKGALLSYTHLGSQKYPDLNKVVGEEKLRAPIFIVNEARTAPDGYQGWKETVGDKGLSVYVQEGLEATRMRELELDTYKFPLIALQIIERDYLRAADGVTTQDKKTILLSVNIDATVPVDEARQAVNCVLTSCRQFANAKCNRSLVVIGTSDGPSMSALELSVHLKTVKKNGKSFFTYMDESMEPKIDELNGFQGIKLTQKPTFCTICQIGFTLPKDFDTHSQGKKHRVNYLLLAYQKFRTNYLKIRNQCGLEFKLKEKSSGVAASNDNQCVINVVADEMKPKTVKLVLQYTQDPAKQDEADVNKGIIIEQIRFMKPDNVFTIDHKHQSTSGKNVSLRILSGRSYEVEVHCQGNQIGHHTGVLMVSHYDEKSPVLEGGKRALHHIAKEIHFRIVNSDVQTISQVSKYKRPVPYYRSAVSETVPGIRPEFRNFEKLPKTVKLDQYFIPAVRRFVIQDSFQSSNSQNQDEAVKCKKLLKGQLSRSCYSDSFQLLLQCEELQQEFDIRQFDMSNVTAEIENRRGLRLFKIKVPGLAENRPSVLMGDRMFLKPSGSSKEYEGHVHDTGENHVYLGLDTGFTNMYLKGMKFDVRFSITRFPLRNMHRAVSMMQSEGLTQALFPGPSGISGQLTIQSIKPFNRQVENNKSQMEAILNIVSRTSGMFPYVIFGPPGTGKTITMVESIKQVLKLRPGSKVLAAAPSNAAADLLAARIKEHVSKSKIIRYNAISRKVKTINKQVLDISNVEGDLVVGRTLDQMLSYAVIVVTLVKAGCIATAKFPDNHFTHVFIDECGHATEPEACIALAGIISASTLKSKGQVVLAGDPKQLGPILRSEYAKPRLGVSLLERMMSMDLYKPKDGDVYNTKFITKLVQNFRSHERILYLPSKLYYQGNLQACGDPVILNSLLNFPGLPDRAKGDFPMIFHGVIGQDLQEAHSPSFFNPEEICIVIQYVMDILAMKANKIAAKEIGIICPYRRQVQKLREKLYSKGPEYKEITVGSTEEFQGQERRVIIISCVRSSPKYVKMDHQYKLGFLRNQKRFNVAITRAKALLVVVGNPHVLGQDADWKALLDYVQNNGGYKGVTYSSSEDEIDRLEQSLHSIALDDADISPVGQYEEPAWRGDL